MQNLLERLRDSHNQILVFLLFAACLVTLLYLYPREAQFKYEYSEAGYGSMKILFRLMT